MDHQQQQQGPAPVPVEQVLQTIRAAMSHITAERAPAEAAIRAWETDAAPGFLHSLMLIVQHGAIDEVRKTNGVNSCCMRCSIHPGAHERQPAAIEALAATQSHAAT